MEQGTACDSWGTFKAYFVILYEEPKNIRSNIWNHLKDAHKITISSHAVDVEMNSLTEPQNSKGSVSHQKLQNGKDKGRSVGEGVENMK